MWIPPAAPTAARARSALKLKSGMLWPSGPGTLWLITVPSAGTTLWIFVPNVRPTRRQLLPKSVRLHGESATMPFISTASLDGSKRGRSVRWTTESGRSRSMGIRKDSPARRTHLLLV
uniref:Uncharacterized protein n=1 Tax=Mus spicilegus TaxID=10103 RepID=A0A8C6HBA6_MUSSI